MDITIPVNFESRLKTYRGLAERVAIAKEKQDKAINLSLEEKSLEEISIAIEKISLASEEYSLTVKEYCEETTKLSEEAYSKIDEPGARDFLKNIILNFFGKSNPILFKINRGINNPYEILGIAEGSTNREIVSAYRNIAKQCRPDLENSSSKNIERFILATEAYEILTSK